MKKKYFSIFGPIVLACLFFVIPPPEGLSSDAWRMFGIFISTILLIMLQGLPEASAIFIGVTAAGLLVIPLKDALSGYMDQTLWLIIVAVMMSIAFKKSGLARRLGLWLIKVFGKSSLGLGYVLGFMDLILAPAIPSAPARTGGLVYPLAQGILEVVNSKPTENPRRLGSYLTVLLYMVSMITGSMFLTAMAPNVLNVKLANDILGVQITWPLWALGALPAFFIFLLVPLIVYKMCPPELTSIEQIRTQSLDQLKSLGPMRRDEIIVAVTYLLALLLWATSSFTKINITIVVFLGVAVFLLLNVLQWKDIAETKETWSMLIWFGGIIGLAAALGKTGFLKWFITAFQQTIPLSGYNEFIIFLVIALLSIFPHYIFPSLVSFVATFSPVLYSLIAATGVPKYPAVLLVCYLMVISSTLTHYGNGLGPMLIETGYIDRKTWWKIGLVISVLAGGFYLTVGLFYWKLVGLY